MMGCPASNSKQKSKQGLIEERRCEINKKQIHHCEF